MNWQGKPPKQNVYVDAVIALYLKLCAAAKNKAKISGLIRGR